MIWSHKTSIGVFYKGDGLALGERDKVFLAATLLGLAHVFVLYGVGNRRSRLARAIEDEIHAAKLKDGSVKGGAKR